jgi:adenylate cyclase class 2
MEIEAKFQLPSHFDIRQRILSLGARSLTGRFLERNTRLDTADRALAADHKLLRLRQGLKNTLTVKHATDRFEARQEYEIEIDDYQVALELLGALGYQKTVIYEKYREIYTLNEVLLMLDEVPYGCFIEIEGQELEQIREAAKQLGLEWSTRVQRSYIAMFNRLRERLEFDFEDVTFSNFASIDPVPQELLKQVLA